MTFEVILTDEAKQDLKEIDKNLTKKALADYKIINEIGTDSNIDIKPLRDGIFEIRSGRIRSLFIYKQGKKIIIAVIFIKKTNKTPEKYITLAKKRLEKYL